MKQLFLFVGCLLSTLAFAQPTPPAALTDLQTLLKQEYPARDAIVNWLADQQAVQIDEFAYPVGEATQLACKRDGGKQYHAEFRLQRGTAVTRVTDSTYRRAYHALPFSSRKNCQEFVRLFGALRTQSFQKFN